MITLEGIARLQTRTWHQTEAAKPGTPRGLPPLELWVFPKREKRHVRHTYLGACVLVWMTEVSKDWCY